MSVNLQKLGGISALIEAAIYVAGFGLFLTVLDASGSEGYVERVEFLGTNQVASYAANLLIYVVFGVVLVVLVLALHARLQEDSPALMQTATVFGLIWAAFVIASGMIANIGTSIVVGLFGENQEQAVALWLSIITVQEALGGGNEIVGGLWVLLLSWAALAGRRLRKLLNYLGVFVGVAGVLTVVPTFGFLQHIFGLSQIVWFAWLGIVMLQPDPRTTIKTKASVS